MSQPAEAPAARAGRGGLVRRLATTVYDLRRLETLVFFAAVLARLIPVLRNGGFAGVYGYDASVYYAAADALNHGRVPYRDFVLLHPPGLMLVETPFAWLGSITSDGFGFAAATLAATVLGGVNAVLVVRLAARIGLPRRAALVGGVVYAFWFGSVVAEYLPRLEPLGNFLLLCGLLALARAKLAPPEAPSGRAAVAAGLAFGALLCVKVWWVVPVGVVVAWLLLVERSYRLVTRVVVGAAVALLVVEGPFLVLARSTMVRMLVLDQLGRKPNNVRPGRMTRYLLFGYRAQNATGALIAVALVGAGLVLVWLLVRAWRVRTARVFVVLLLAQIAQLRFQPSWFTFYADFITVPAAVVMAAAAAPYRQPVASEADHTTDHTTGRTRPWLPISVAAAFAVLLPIGLSPHLITPFPSQRLTAAARHLRCVMSDSPMSLIQMDALSRGLAAGCRNWVDVTGRLYGVDKPTTSHGHEKYTRWNRDVGGYLRSGDAVIFVRTPASIRISRATERKIMRDGVITSAGGYTLYATRPARASTR